MQAPPLQLVPARDDRSLGATLRRWDEYLSVGGYADETRRQYRYHLVKFLADTMLDLSEVTEDDVVSYLARLDGHGSQRGQVLRGLSSYYKWASGREVMVNPMARLRIHKAKYGRAPYLSAEQLTQLVIAAAYRDPRRAWTILLMYGTGARLASLAALRIEDVAADSIYFRTAKGGTPYTMPLGPLGRAAIEGLLTTRPVRATEGLLIGVKGGAIWSWVHQASVDAEVKAWPHLFRHSFATRLVEAGTDLNTVRELMNHADLSQIPRYVTITDTRKRDAVAAL